MKQLLRRGSNPWVELCEIGKEKNGVYFIGADEVWITEVGGQKIIVSNICPHHDEALISMGDKKGAFVRCPWRGHWFDLITGSCGLSS